MVGATLTRKAGFGSLLLRALDFASRSLSPCGCRLGLQTLAVSLRFNV
jgi:hypothetical protein